MYIFRVTNQNFAGGLSRSVSQGVYIFIPTNLFILLLPLLLSGHGAACMSLCHASPNFHRFDFSMDKMRRFFYTRTDFVISLKHKLLINNIRSMEVNPFIRKLIPFFYREVFYPARKWRCRTGPPAPTVAGSAQRVSGLCSHRRNDAAGVRLAVPRRSSLCRR